MAWAPSTSFEDDLVNFQPDFDLIHGQLAYEAKRRQEFIPRPKSTYEYLANRQRRNAEIDKVNASKSKEIRGSLAMMERIQEIAGTKPLGEHATMADWDDTSTVEKEAISMMRHFGMMSMMDGTLEAPRTAPEPLPEGNIHIIRNGRRSFPLILDPNYFEPGRKRQNSMSNTSSDSSSQEMYDEIPNELLEETTSMETKSQQKRKTK
ncbi:uncharacterized protein LOC6570235 [Drosophila grimshawi]|uniref:GH25198 n=1 Tax=Drosophila grimshawi TaxID=7222 RepID=B4JZ79_DROGR|nr:uncharacterized protein LOC6570235 [Drosophila grimshawi]EDV94188.1 GH25198 [Drosophila grimshawi]